MDEMQHRTPRCMYFDQSMQVSSATSRWIQRNFVLRREDISVTPVSLDLTPLTFIDGQLTRRTRSCGSLLFATQLDLRQILSISGCLTKLLVACDGFLGSCDFSWLGMHESARAAEHLMNSRQGLSWIDLPTHQAVAARLATIPATAINCETSTLYIRQEIEISRLNLPWFQVE